MKLDIRFKVLLLAVSLVGVSCSHPNVARVPAQQPCRQVRAAFDVGSSSTKLKVAEVDTCLQKVLAVLFESQEKVPYAQELQASTSEGGRREFSAALMEKGIQALIRLKREAEAKGVSVGNFSGVATAAFRDAGNSTALVQRIRSEQGIRLQIISQQEEGILGFYSALSRAEARVDEAVVWDIGSRSMQLTFRREDGEFEVFPGKLASVSFKEVLLSEIQKSTARSPNPVSREHAERGVEWAVQDASAQVPAPIARRIRATGVVYGMGGVLGGTLQAATGRNAVTESQVLEALSRLTGKTDSEIGGPFADTVVSNLALVAGYMKALGIRQIVFPGATSSDGILIHPKYWD